MTSRRLLVFSGVGLLLVDAPVLLVVLVASVHFGFRDSLVGILDWRRAHPASYALSLIAVLLVTYRTRTA